MLEIYIHNLDSAEALADARFLIYFPMNPTPQPVLLFNAYDVKYSAFFSEMNGVGIL